MKYLIDIGHPAHVHYFKNFAFHAINRGDSVLFTCRDKDVAISLLKYYNFNYISFGKNFKSKMGKILGLIKFTLKTFLISYKYRPDMFINASIYSAITSSFFRKPHISLEDTFNMEQVNLYYPFTSCVLTGNYDHPALGSKEIIYDGYQELLYLHPNTFQPNNKVLEQLGLKEDDKFVILRFVSWNASHDYGHKGVSIENKIKAVQEFSKYAKVFISSEAEIPKELEKYRITLEPHRMHDALAFADLVWGESATMISEAAVLGTPGIYLDNTGRYYTSEQEYKYGLCYNYSESEEEQQKAINKGLELLENKYLKETWQKKRQQMLNEKIDVTGFLIWFIENYPESKKIMKENPDYQFNFK